MNEPPTIGARFSALRADQGLRLRDIHDRSGVAISYVSRLEHSDDWSGVSLGRLARLARAVGTTPGYLLGGDYLDGGRTQPMTTPPQTRAGIPTRTFTDAGEDNQYDTSISYNAFLLCLAARRHGWAKADVLAAFERQWESTERMAGAFGGSASEERSDDLSS